MPMTLRAHPNVIPLSEERRKRLRAARVATGWFGELLTEAEIAALRREAKETSAYARRAFARRMAAPESEWWRDE